MRFSPEFRFLRHPRRIRAALITGSICVAVFSNSAFASDTTPVPKVNRGGVDLDMPVPQEGGPQQSPRAFGPRRSSAMTTLQLWDFEAGGGGPDTQGWTRHDLRLGDGFIAWHVDGSAGNMTGGDFGLLVPIAGNKSLWCGAAPSSSEPHCSYATLPGYGNGWNQIIIAENLTHFAGMDVFINYEISYDTEAGYDKIWLEHRPVGGTWTNLKISTGGPVPDDYMSGLQSPPTGKFNVITYWPATPATFDLRFRFESDAAWSDEDGSFDTDGAVMIDNIDVRDEAGHILAPVEDFEGEPLGATETDDGIWKAMTIGAGGDFAALYPGTTRLQESPPLTLAEINPSHLWAFVDASADYGCGGFPAEQAVPFPNAAGIPIRNSIRSPWISWEPAPGQTTHIAFDVYRNLPVDNLVFYEWRVRQRTAGSCATTWSYSSFVYYGSFPEWHRADHDVTAYMTPTPGADEIQVELTVVDLIGVWTGGTGACHTNAPLFDNVEIYLDNTHSWVVSDLDLFSDAFPDDGTATGTIRADAASGADEARILVTESGVGIDDLVPGDPGSGPAVFCHVGNLPGKSGAAVSGGPDWPYVASMSDADWTVIQLAPGAAANEYTVDLADALYTPGDVVRFYFSARDKNGVTTYWSQFTGRVNAEAEARDASMEFTALPANALFNLTSVLYVDDFSGWGAEPMFASSFFESGIAPDRYDVRSPSSLAGNGPGDAVSNMTKQVFQYYDTVIWNTGSLGSSLEPTDYQFMASFLNDHPASPAVIYLGGDNAPSQLASSPDPSASFLRSNYIDFSVTTGDHKTVGLPVSPFVTGEGNTPYDGMTLIAWGGGSPAAAFDVLSPGQSAEVLMNYQGGQNPPAMIQQVSQNDNKSVVGLVLAGFSHHIVHDDEPAVPQDRTALLSTILNSTTGTGGQPTATGAAPLANQLAQNVPNPFNPVTTIAFTVKERGRVGLRVYDVSGGLVRTLVDGELGAGEIHSVEWNGRDNDGRKVASGVYFYRLTAPGFVESRKMVLLK